MSSADLCKACGSEGTITWDRSDPDDIVGQCSLCDAFVEWEMMAEKVGIAERRYRRTLSPEEARLREAANEATALLRTAVNQAVAVLRAAVRAKRVQSNPDSDKPSMKYKYRKKCDGCRKTYSHSWVRTVGTRQLCMACRKAHHQAARGEKAA